MTEFSIGSNEPSGFATTVLCSFEWLDGCE